MCGDTYIIDHGIAGYQVASIEPTVVSVYYWSGAAWTFYKSHDFTDASRTNFLGVNVGNDQKGAAAGTEDTDYIGPAHTTAPWRFIGTGRFALRTNDTDDHEYFVFGYDSNLRSQETIRAGKIIADDISANAITANKISANAVTGDKILGTTDILVGPSGSEQVGLRGGDTGDDQVRIFAGNSIHTAAPFRVTHVGALTATNATITGTVNASGGTFTGDVTTTGGFSAGNAGIDGDGSGDDAVRFYAGADLANKILQNLK